jgi:hypothetical protein
MPDAGGVIRLEQGEFLLHPVSPSFESILFWPNLFSVATISHLGKPSSQGSLVHAGVDVTSGSRYLMVMFAHIR